MTSVIFVHGTGVREDAYKKSLSQVQRSLAKDKDLSVERCYWGHLGAELRADGASIPEYDTSRAIALNEGSEATEMEYTIALWEMLYQDPLFELRALAARGTGASEFVPGELSPGMALEAKARNFDIAPLQGLLERAEIAGEFVEARRAITDSAEFRHALAGAPDDLGDYRAAIARALIAESVVSIANADAPLPAVTMDMELRDEVERALLNLLGGQDRAIAGWVNKQFAGLALRLTTRIVRRRRHSVSDGATPAAGDILLYQVRGQEIRKFIRDKINACPAPRVVIGHSLGGIACVDLCAAEGLDVQLLVTVGSQSPLFYEINALQSLEFGKPLPAHFPRWLNIYDLRDFLSYKGEALFNKAGKKVTDVKVDNGQPFHWSHSAYWWNDDVWNAIRVAIKDAPRAAA